MIQNHPLFVDAGQGISLMIGLPTINSWNSDSRPRKPKTGTLGFNSQTNSLEYWNGSYWLAASMNIIVT